MKVSINLIRVGLLLLNILFKVLKLKRVIGLIQYFVYLCIIIQLGEILSRRLVSKGQILDLTGEKIMIDEVSLLLLTKLNTR